MVEQGMTGWTIAALLLGSGALAEPPRPGLAAADPKAAAPTVMTRETVRQLLGWLQGLPAIRDPGLRRRTIIERCGETEGCATGCAVSFGLCYDLPESCARFVALGCPVYDGAPDTAGLWTWARARTEALLRDAGASQPDLKGAVDAAWASAVAGL
jgi:hypothetical protein